MRTAGIATVVAPLTVWATLASPAPAHPGSGIVVDRNGQVFFQDTAGRVIWKIDARGQVSPFYDKMGGHWMALDAGGHFAGADVAPFRRITPPGAKPALIVADGGAPIAVNGEGNLYYGLAVLNGDKVAPGITRFAPDGKRSPFAPGLREVVEKLGITGLAAGPDGALFVACPSAVLKVKTDGTFTTVVHPVVVKDCDVDYPDNNPNFPLPALRGLAVDPRGVVYAAATGCHRLVKITPDGPVETVLKAERPWSPTGVALHDGAVYVLEYTNANGGANDGWLPRVRRLGRDGKVTTLVTLSQELQRKGMPSDRRPPGSPY